MRRIALFKKAALATTAALLCLAFLLALAACGEASKVVIKTALTDELEQLKDSGSELWREAIDSSGGALTEDFINAWGESFSFEIGEITVEGEAATAQVSLTCKQLLPVMESAQEILLADESLATMTEDEILKKLEEVFLAELGTAQTTTTDILVSYELIENTWEPGSQVESEFEKALVGSA
jgi:hypothetical protein